MPTKKAAKPATRAVVAKPVAQLAGRKEYPLLADLPPVPAWKLGTNGKPILQRVPVIVEGQKVYKEEKIPFDPNGELQHRNRFGEMLMYEVTLQKKKDAAHRIPITVNDHRYTLLRGHKVVMPWFAVHHMRLNIEAHFSQEPDPMLPGRSQVIREDIPGESILTRPINPCDDFDDETAHLPAGADAPEGHDGGEVVEETDDERLEALA